MQRDDLTDEQRLHSDALARFDSSGGLTSALFDVLDAAEAAGHDVGHIRELAESLDGDLQEGFNAVDSTDPDPEEVADRATAAKNIAAEICDELSDELEAFEVPDDAATGQYGTLGEWAEYIRGYMTNLSDTAEKYHAASQ